MRAGRRSRASLGSEVGLIERSLIVPKCRLGEQRSAGYNGPQLCVHQVAIGRNSVGFGQGFDDPDPGPPATTARSDPRREGLRVPRSHQGRWSGSLSLGSGESPWVGAG